MAKKKYHKSKAISEEQAERLKYAGAMGLISRTAKNLGLEHAPDRCFEELVKFNQEKEK